MNPVVAARPPTPTPTPAPLREEGCVTAGLLFRPGNKGLQWAARPAQGQVSAGSCGPPAGADAAPHGPQVDVEPRAASALGHIPHTDGASALCQALRIPQCKRRGNNLLCGVARDETGGGQKQGAGAVPRVEKDHWLQRGQQSR